jgi:hypothetical protein
MIHVIGPSGAAVQLGDDLQKIQSAAILDALANPGRPVSIATQTEATRSIRLGRSGNKAIAMSVMAYLFGDDGDGCPLRLGPSPKQPGQSRRGGGRCPRCGSVWAARDISLTVREGETLGIVSESGSGKSTLTRALYLDVEPAGGGHADVPGGGIPSNDGGG